MSEAPKKDVVNYQLKANDFWPGIEEGRAVERAARKATLVSVAKQANKAAMAVTRYEVRPDGTVVVVTGKGEQQQSSELDEWIAKHADKTQRHLEKFFSPSRCESDSLTAMGHGRMERASHGA